MNVLWDGNEADLDTPEKLWLSREFRAEGEAETTLTVKKDEDAKRSPLASSSASTPKFQKPEGFERGSGPPE
jgi:hypothetical protein